MQFIDTGNKAGEFPFCQELVFHVGPSVRDAQSVGQSFDQAWFDRRAGECRSLLLPDAAGRPPLAGLFDEVLQEPLSTLRAGMTAGGVRGMVCPNVRVDSLRSSLQSNTRLCDAIKRRPDSLLQVCEQLAMALAAKWIVGWHYGMYGNRQVEFVQKSGALH
jgi:hypothetical protein